MAAAAIVGGCNTTSESPWPSLSGGDPRGSDAQTAASAQPASQPEGQARVEIPSSPADRAGQSGQAGTTTTTAAASPTTTVVGQRVARLREDVQRLQSSVAANSRALQQRRADAVQAAQRYYTLVGGINARLQVGTTPGNPVLQGQWAEANQELDRIAAEIGRMTALSNDVAGDAALAAFLLESIRAAYALSGAVEEDHRQLAALEDEVNRSTVTIDRLLNELSEDVTRQSAYVSRERSNMTTLAVAIKNGELYGGGLANRTFGPLTPPDSAPAVQSRASTGQSARSAAPAPGDRPLVVIRFDRPKPSYEQALYTAVSRALERRPQAIFDVVAVATTKGNQAQAALAQTNSKRQAEQVVRSLTDMGLPPSRVRLSSTTSASAQSNEVHLYVR
ncbi:MAG TPA: hypothetical protein VF342_12690 [Alphaproteobacteria bacterium]